MFRYIIQINQIIPEKGRQSGQHIINIFLSTWMMHLNILNDHDILGL